MRARGGGPPAREELTQAVLEAEELWRRAARESLEAWLYRYLPAEFNREPGEFQRGIYADLERCVRRQPIDGAVRDAVAYAYPRGHGKTTTCAVGFALWVICEWERMPHFQGKPPFILIVSSSPETARDRLLDIRDHLETNERLIAEYGDLTPPRGLRDEDDDEGDPTGKARRKKAKPGAYKWTQTDFMTRTGVRVKAVGTNSRIRGALRKGRRPTLIIGDDVENDEHVMTPEQRQKLERWFQKALLPTGIQGELLTIIVGTILHADSLLSRLLSDEYYPGWLKRRFAALYNDAGEPDAEGDHPLWPQYWPKERLLARRRLIGALAFEQEYLNRAVSDQTSLFPRALFDQPGVKQDYALGLRDVPAEIQGAGGRRYATWWQAQGMTTYLGADLAISAEQGAHYFVVFVLAVDRRGNRWVVDIIRRRGLGYQAQVDTIIETARRYAVALGLVEANQYQRVIPDMVTEQSDVPIRAFYTTGRESKRATLERRGASGNVESANKRALDAGVPSLRILFENGKVRIPWAESTRPTVEQWIGEMNAMAIIDGQLKTYAAHDDTVMAFWLAEQAARRGAVFDLGFAGDGEDEPGEEPEADYDFFGVGGDDE